jgi:two-component system, NarL family, sensor histidine kinase DegS
VPDAQAEPSTDATPERAGSLADRLATEVGALENELREIEMLVGQARTESERHETKRAQVADKLTQGTNLPAEDVTALSAQLVTLTRRASVMESQVEVLEGKRKTLQRFRDRLAELGSEYGAEMPGIGGGGKSRPTAGTASGEATGAGAGDAEASTGSPMSRIVLNAQEDLRREIARSMHDGPAQSLTNIVLQAQIVERLMGRDPEGARSEVRLLMSMVQQTLEATKNFIFDVRPMVLDDLGLVPTLRRAARERGRRAGVAVEFDSIGQDRRLEMDLESSLFRILDEALGAYLASMPDRVAMRLDWSDDIVEARIVATREPTAAMANADREVADVAEASDAATKDLPPALEAMLADRRVRAEGAVVAAREAAIVSLPEAAWRLIQQRAITTGIKAELGAGGGDLHLRAEIAGPADDATEPA